MKKIIVMMRQAIDMAHPIYDTTSRALYSVGLIPFNLMHNIIQTKL